MLPLIVGVAALSAAPLYGQEDPPPADTVAVPPTPGEAADSLAADSAVSPVVRQAARDTTDRPSGPAPMSAFLRSVLVPGWGQLAADQPVRAAFYFVAQSATVYMVVRTNDRIRDAESEELKAARREQREDWLVLAGFWALASGIDAWVSAHMWGFEGEVVPPPDGSAGMALRVSVPVRGF